MNPTKKKVGAIPFHARMSVREMVDVKISVKQDYEKSRYLGPKVRAYIDLVRPFTLIAPGAAVLFGILISLASIGKLSIFWENWAVVIYCMVTMMLAQGAGQAINQSEDPVALDKINRKDYRPAVQKILRQEEIRGFGLLLALIATARAFTIKSTFGIFIIIIIFFAIFYSMEPIRAKRRFWVNVIWLATSRGLLPIPAAWSVFGSPLDATPWLLGSVLFFWVGAFQVTKDIPDVKGDKKYNIPTLPVVYGVKKTTLIMNMLSTLSFALLMLYILAEYLPMWTGLSLVLFIPSYWITYRIERKEPSELELLENSIEWVTFYLCLAGWYVLFFIGFLIR